MKRTLILLGSAIVIGILIWLKISVFSGKTDKTIRTNSNPAIPVECYLAKDTSVNYQLETVGNLSAREHVDIVSEISRKVVGILMKEGAGVTAGQLLFKLDAADIISRINKLAIELTLAESSESREKVLLSKGGISQERFDEVSNRRQSIQAEIEIMKVDLSKTEIRAPFAGKIGLRSISEGALVTPGTILANLQDISRMKIDFSIPERYSRDLQVGSPIIFRTDYLPQDQSARVEAIEPAVDQRTRTLLVRADTDNKDDNLVPGTSAKVTLTLGAKTRSIFIPTSALIPSIKGYTVFISQKRTARVTPVKTGIRNRDFVQILDGVKSGDTLITTNLLRLKNGSPLTIVKIN